MQLEDLKAQARRRGEDDSNVTLPHVCHVSYAKVPKKSAAVAAAAAGSGPAVEEKEEL